MRRTSLYRRTESKLFFCLFVIAPKPTQRIVPPFLPKAPFRYGPHIPRMFRTGTFQCSGFRNVLNSHINSYYFYLLLSLPGFENQELIVDLSFIKIKTFSIPNRFASGFYDFLQNIFHRHNLQVLHPYQDLYNRYNLSPHQPLKTITSF